MTLLFTEQAVADLDELERYLGDVSPSGLAAVLGALARAFRMIAANPALGRPTERTGVRVLVEPDYRYVLPYYVRDDETWILRVYHPKRRPLVFSALDLP